MSTSPRTDVGNQLKANAACGSESSNAPSLITAAGTGDNTKVTGETIDLLDTESGLPKSGLLVTTFLARLQDTETISLAHELQESSDGINWDTAEVVEAATVYATAAGSTQNLYGVAPFAVNLVGRKRYIRFNVTPNLSASGTDTAEFTTAFVTGGYDVTPVS